MKIRPIKQLKKLFGAIGSAKASRQFVKALNLGEREDDLGVVLAPISLLPAMGALAEATGILKKGQFEAALAGVCAALPVVVREATASKDTVVTLESDDMA